MNTREKKQSRFSIIISLLLHLGLLIFVLMQDPSQKEAIEQPLEVQWVEIQKTPEPLNKRAQIVQQDEKAINDKTPEKDYKLSKNNQDVKQETRAKKNGVFQNKRNTKAGQQQVSAQQKVQSPLKNQKILKALNQFKPKLFDDNFSEEKLAPKPRAALSGAEVSQNDDYLKDVVMGAETLLKTREFVYYSYYNRIKRKLRQHWEPRIKEKIVKILRKGRRIASVNDKITRLVITLDQGGELVRIQVRNASGYNDLDDAAIEAFRAAAPFPNPPSGIVNGTGQVEINWDFVLET